MKRTTLHQRLHSLWRRSWFNPYRLDQILLREGVAGLGAQLHGRLLDVGCGERPYAEHFPNIQRYYGVEHLAAVINVDERLAASVAHVSHCIDAFADGANLPFRDAVFDSVIATEVLEHVPNPERVVAEMARVLRDGGLALITVPFVGELHQIPYDFRRYTKFGIELQIQEAGFDILENRSRGNFLLTAGRCLAHSIYRLGGKYVKQDGAVRMHRWMIPIVLPLSAAVIGFFSLIGRFSKDDSLCLGYCVLARRRPRAS
jgi:SAM-dependent methyltransferase